MNFFVIINKNAIYTYERDAQRIEPQFIEGSELFSLSSANISEDVNSYMEILANEKNLGTVAKLEFEVLESSDCNFNAAIETALEEHINKIYSLEDTLKTVIKKLLRDKKLMIDTYGINYEGCSYKLENDDIVQGEFNLLGYTIHCSDVVELMDL
jgi:hypothetical protein